MSTDKLQALDEALADAFAESPRISTHTESPHPAFDHEALSGIFGESSPISTSTQPPHPSFDQGTFAEVLSQLHPISTHTTPSPPAFDQGTLAEALSQTSPDPATTERSPPSFDHQALAEILSEPRPVPINPQLSSFSFDTGQTSAPLSGQLDNEETAAKTAVVASSTDPEDARPQRAKSLLAKLHHIFSTKAEPPPGIEKDPSSPSPSRQLKQPEPVTKTIAFSTNDENARPQQTTSLPTDPPPPDFERESPSPRLAGQPGDQTPAAQTVAIAPPTDSTSAQAQQASSLLIESGPPSSTTAETDQPHNLEPTVSAAPTEADSAEAPHDRPSQTRPRLISAKGETCSATREKETSHPPLPSQPDDLEPAAEMVAVALPADTESARPQRVTSLAAEASAPNSYTRSSPANFPTQPYRTPQLDNVGLAESTVAVGPAKPPLQKFAKEPSRLNPASRTASVARPPVAEDPVTQQREAQPLTNEVPGLDSTEWRSPSRIVGNGSSPRAVPARSDHAEPAAKFGAVAVPADEENALTRAPQARSLLAELDLNTAIRLRWVMRDIRSERTKLAPPNENDLAALVKLGLVELREGLPSLTALGVLALG